MTQAEPPATRAKTVFTLALLAFSGTAQAETAMPPATPDSPWVSLTSISAPAPAEISAVLDIFVERVVLDTQGLPSLDDSGKQIVEFRPISGEVISPGDLLEYRVGLSGNDVGVENIDINLPLPGGLLLSAMSLQASADTEFSVSAVAEDGYVPVFSQASGAKTLSDAYGTALAKGLDGMKARIARLDPENPLTISYHLTVQ